MISQIKLKNFRKYKNLDLTIKEKYVLIVGDNAVGKTTILESIYITSVTKSHRTNNLKDFQHQTEPYSSIEITADQKKYKMVITPLGKKVLIDNQEINKLSEYIGKFITVFFTPSDLDLVLGSPSIRRKFINQEISLLKNRYIHDLNKFQDLLQERNSFLKQINETKENNLTFLNLITQQLNEFQIPIMQTREKFVNELNSLIAQIHPMLATGEKLELKYEKSLPNGDLDKFYESKLKNDLLTQQTNYGIHRDDILFLLNEQQAEKFASQGQIKTIVLSIKLALCELIKKYRHKYPVLLLDDVLSELDLIRQEKLLKIVENYEQTFITATNYELIDKKILDNYQIIKLVKEKNHE